MRELCNQLRYKLHTGITLASHRHGTGFTPASHRLHTGIAQASHRHRRVHQPPVKETRLGAHGCKNWSNPQRCGAEACVPTLALEFTSTQAAVGQPWNLSR